MALASPAEPLVLADGRLVYPDGSIVDPSEEQETLVAIPTNREATQLVVAARRKLVDLPDVPRTMNAIGVILSYTLFGLDDTEIALATNLSEKQIGTFKMGEPYAQMHESVVNGILKAETDNVRELFQQHSRSAVSQLIKTLNTSKSETNRIAVAKDMLDRAGHRPADVVEHRHSMSGGLVIEIVRKDTGAQAPIINMETGDDD